MQRNYYSTALNFTKPDRISFSNYPTDEVVQGIEVSRA